MGGGRHRTRAGTGDRRRRARGGAALIRARFTAVDRDALAGEAQDRAAAWRRRRPLPGDAATLGARAPGTGLRDRAAAKMAGATAADRDRLPRTAAPADPAGRRPLRIRILNADEGRNYLAGERISDDLAAGRALDAALGADLPVVEDALVLAAGLLSAGDWPIERLLERGGLYDRLVASQVAAHTRVSERTVARLARRILERRVFDPLDSLQGGDWRATAVRHLAPHHGRTLIPYLERESYEAYLALVAESWPEEAIAALVRLGRRPYPGFQRRVIWALASVARRHPRPALDAILLLAAEVDALTIPAAVAVGQAAIPDDPAALAGPPLLVPPTQPGFLDRLIRRTWGTRRDGAAGDAPELPAPARWVERLVALAAADDGAIRVAVPYAVARLALVDPSCVGPTVRETLARLCGERVRAYESHRRDARIGVTAFALATAPEETPDREQWEELVAALDEEAAASGWLVDAVDDDWRAHSLRQAAAAHAARLALHARIQAVARHPVALRRWLWELVHTHLGRAVVHDLIGEPSATEPDAAVSLHRPLPEVIMVGPRHDRPIPVVAIADPTSEIRDRDADDAREVLARDYPVAGLPILVKHLARRIIPDQRLLRDALERIAHAEPDTFLRLLEEGIVPNGGGERLWLQRHGSPAVRQALAAGLGKLGVQRPSAAAEVLAALKRDRDRSVRRQAGHELKDLLAAHPDAAPRSPLEAALRAARDAYFWSPQLAALPAPLQRATYLLLWAPRALLLLVLSLPFLLPLGAIWLLLFLLVKVIGPLFILVIAGCVYVIVFPVSMARRGVRHFRSLARRARVRASGGS